MNDLIEKFEKILTKEQLDSFSELKSKMNSLNYENEDKEKRISELAKAVNDLTDVVLKKIAPSEDNSQKKTSEEAAADLKD